jgi:hypothetical protein
MYSGGNTLILSANNVQSQLISPVGSIHFGTGPGNSSDKIRANNNASNSASVTCYKGVSTGVAGNTNIDGFAHYINSTQNHTDIRHFYAINQGLTGTVTNQYGYLANSNLSKTTNNSSATNNYGFFSELVNSDNGGNNYNFYAAGSAPNYFNGGVQFDTADGSTALDDYEEGTYTPSIEGSTTAGSYTAGTKAGFYTKIGNCITVTFNFNGITVNTAGTGSIKISLPFSAANATGMLATGSARLISIAFNNSPDTLDAYCVPSLSKNASALTLSVIRSGQGITTVNTGAIVDGDGIQGTITYLTSTNA